MSDKNQAEICSLSGRAMTREGAYDSLREVLKMKTDERTGYTVDSWIAEEDLPVRANLKVIRRNDPDYGFTQDEIQDRHEFIRCYLMKDFELLIMIPKQETENDFFIPDCEVDSPEYSAFNTNDFQRRSRPFDKYGYAMKKIMERVKDLAIQHSVVGSRECRMNTYQRYETLVDLEFRYRLMDVVEKYNMTENEVKKFILKKKIGEMNRRILEARKIWEQHAPRDT